MNSHKWSTIFVCVSLLLCGLSAHFAFGMKHTKKVKFCKMDMLLECGNEPVARFTSIQNGAGIVNSTDEMEQYCFNLVDYAPICAKQWFNRCASPTHLEVLDRLFLKPMVSSVKVFCDPSGQIRNEFLKYSSCLITEVKLSASYRKKCVRPLQAAGEFIHERNMKSPNLSDFLGSTCCAFNMWEGCILDHLTRKCGKPSADVFPYLIHQTSFNVLRSMCNPERYDYTNAQKCDPSKFIAPEDFKPKGLQSNSILSYMFSYSCPNVGWGIVPERDW